MIYVSQDQLDQVEYLITQSIQGHHALFGFEGFEDVKRILEKGAQQPIQESEAYEVEPHIERLILQPSLEEKKAYLEGLDRKTYERVVLTYFNIVENNLKERSEVRH
ncbi:MAG: hypothetical protein JNL01_09630 [Bdellovibrionales bacterium]|nr:hypothetical protein [Bdellovibrionales bacterium]